MLRAESAAQTVVDECFWGDCIIDAERVLAMVADGTAYTDSFLVGRIIDNAREPSRLLRALFPHERILRALDRPHRTFKSAYHERRFRLVRANLTGEYSLVPERQWPVK